MAPTAMYILRQANKPKIYAVTYYNAKESLPLVKLCEAKSLIGPTYAKKSQSMRKKVSDWSKQPRQSNKLGRISLSYIARQTNILRIDYQVSVSVILNKSYKTYNITTTRENRINERTLFSQTQHPPDLKRCSVLGTGTYPRYKGLLTNLLYPKTTKEICHLAKYLLYLLLK